MTLVLLIPRKDTVKCFSDSRVSEEPTGMVLTDYVPKILSFSVRSRFRVNKPKRFEIKQEFDVGFAFAGSTLFAMTVYSMATTLCRTIFSHKSRKPPSMDFISEQFRFSFEHVGTDINSRKAIGKTVPCEIAVFGFCRSERRMKTFHIKPILTAAGYEGDKSDVSDEVILHMGSNAAFKKHIQPYVDRFKMTGTPITASDVLTSAIKDNSIPDVGGSLQYCCADKRGVEIFPLFSPSEKSIHLFGASLDQTSNYDSTYTLGDISEGAEIMGFIS